MPQAFPEQMVAKSAQVPARVWKAALAGLTNATPPTDVATITAPTLILWGEHDELLARADQEALATAIPAPSSSPTRAPATSSCEAAGEWRAT